MAITKTYNEINFIDFIMKKTDDIDWIDEFNCKFVLPNKIKIAIKFPDGSITPDKFYITATKTAFSQLEAEYNSTLTITDIKNSVFDESYHRSKTLLPSFIKIGFNKQIFLELNKYFKELGINQVIFYNNNESDSIGCFEKITMFINPNFETLNLDIQYNVEETSSKLKEIYKPSQKFKNLGLFTTSGYINPKIPIIQPEKIIPIEIRNIVIGHYYKSRNLINIIPNIFSGIDYTNETSIESDDTLGFILKDLKKSITALDIKVQPIEDFNFYSTIYKFMGSIRERKKTLENTHSNIRKDIETYEQKLINNYKNVEETLKELTAVDNIINSNFNLIKENLENARNQPIVDSIEIKNSKIHITFKETTIQTNVSRTVDLLDGTLFETYLGKIRVELDGSGQILVFSDYNCNGHSHPHCNSNNIPCLGTGDGKETIIRCLSKFDFVGFVYSFWMWIKKYNPEDSYIKPYIWIDDKLKQGLPVFESATKRQVYINDEALLKSGDFINLEKHLNYDKNLAATKHFKI